MVRDLRQIGSARSETKTMKYTKKKKKRQQTRKKVEINFGQLVLSLHKIIFSPTNTQDTFSGLAFATLKYENTRLSSRA